MAAPPSSSREIFGRKDLLLPGILMFGRYQYAASRSCLPPHSHRRAIEICFLERGEQTYRVGGLLHRLRGNDQFFTLPGEVHDTAMQPEERGILYWLILKISSSKKFLGLSNSQALLLKRELGRMPNRHFRAHPDSARILGEVNNLLLESRKQAVPTPSLHSLRLQALLLHYLTLTIRASHQGIRGSATPLMQRVLVYIDHHLTDPVHVPMLAQIARLSESRFKMRFKREIGVPPAEFWLRKKMERAILLLKSRSVTEVAYELSFSSSQYFATVFKRYTLVNPSRFHP